VSPQLSLLPGHRFFFPNFLLLLVMCSPASLAPNLFYAKDPFPFVVVDRLSKDLPSFTIEMFFLLSSYSKAFFLRGCHFHFQKTLRQGSLSTPRTGTFPPRSVAFFIWRYYANNVRFFFVYDSSLKCRF